MFFLPPCKASEFIAWIANCCTKGDESPVSPSPFSGNKDGRNKSRNQSTAQGGLNPFYNNSTSSTVTGRRVLRTPQSPVFPLGEQTLAESSSLVKLDEFQCDLHRTDSKRLAGPTSFLKAEIQEREKRLKSVLMPCSFSWNSQEHHQDVTQAS